MITKITGKLVRLGDTEAVLEVGPFEYEVFVPDFVRRQLQSEIGQTVSLRTIEYIEGNPQQGRLTPRLVGFMNEAEVEFFELICSVDGVGVRKALRAIVRPVREVAAAIEEQNIEELVALPGVGPAVAERIIAKLRRKMARFALMVARECPAAEDTAHDVVRRRSRPCCSLGHSAADAHKLIDSVTADQEEIQIDRRVAGRDLPAGNDGRSESRKRPFRHFSVIPAAQPRRRQDRVLRAFRSAARSGSARRDRLWPFRTRFWRVARAGRRNDSGGLALMRANVKCGTNGRFSREKPNSSRPVSKSAAMPPVFALLRGPPRRRWAAPVRKHAQSGDFHDARLLSSGRPSRASRSRTDQIESVSPRNLSVTWRLFGSTALTARPMSRQLL